MKIKGFRSFYHGLKFLIPFNVKTTSQRSFKEDPSPGATSIIVKQYLQNKKGESYC